MNEFLFFATIVLNFCGILLAYKIFGKAGLYTWIGFATVLANIEVTKNVDIFHLAMTLGNVIYGTTFLATDILSEKYGDKDARKGVWIGLFTTIVFTVLMQISLLFVPNESDFVSSSMKEIFSLMPRICFASITAYFISNMLDTYLFAALKKRIPKHVWLRNNAATMICQLLDSTLFTIIAFAGVFPLDLIVELIFTTYVAKVIIAACDTPFLYWAIKIQPNSD